MSETHPHTIEDDKRTMKITTAQRDRLVKAGIIDKKPVEHDSELYVINQPFNWGIVDQMLADDPGAVPTSPKGKPVNRKGNYIE